MGIDQSGRYQAILEGALTASGAERGCIVVLNQATNLPDIVVSINWEDVVVEDQYAFKMVISQVFAESTPIITTNLDQQAPTFQSIDDFRVFIPRSILCMPFQLNRISGAVYLDIRILRHTFSDEDTQRLQSFLAQYAAEN